MYRGIELTRHQRVRIDPRYLLPGTPEVIYTVVRVGTTTAVLSGPTGQVHCKRLYLLAA